MIAFLVYLLIGLLLLWRLLARFEREDDPVRLRFVLVTVLAWPVAMAFILNRTVHYYRILRRRERKPG